MKQAEATCYVGAINLFSQAYEKFAHAESYYIDCVKFDNAFHSCEVSATYSTEGMALYNQARAIESSCKGK